MKTSLVTFCALLVSSASASSLCSDVRLERLPVCIEGVGGVVLATDEAEALAIRDALELARPVFSAHFGMEAPRYAVVFDSPSKEEVSALRAAGFVAVLPWISSQKLLAGIEEQIRIAIREKIPGISKEQEDAAVAGKLGELKDTIANNVVPAHEMGHMWFMQAFWPDAEGGRHYGGPAPDWLDETAAVLMESGALEDNRRERFKQDWMAGGNIAPLSEYFAMKHPVLDEAKAKAAAAGIPSGAGGTVIVSQASPEIADKAAGFYAQTLVFTDFLIAESGDLTILKSITEAAVAGDAFEVWLAANGASKNLPADLNGLQSRWESWAVKTYGAPG